MKKFQVTLATLALVLIAVAQVRADDKAPTSDKEFIAHAHGMCQTVVKLSQVAEKQATNPAVREFATDIVKDHQKFADELATLAKNQGVSTSSELSREGQSEVDRLSKLQGAEFDKEYIDQMVKDHQKALDVCENQSKTSTSPDVKKCSQERIATITDHLNRAKEIAKTIK